MNDTRLERLRAAACSVGLPIDIIESNDVDLDALYAAGGYQFIHALFPAQQGVSDTAQLLTGKSREEAIVLIKRWLAGGEIWNWKQHPY